MDVFCDRCGAPMEHPGALAFSPPDSEMTGGNGVVSYKFHLCRSVCWPIIARIIGELH